MAKEKSVKKEAKKAPALTPKEKKLAKAEKKAKKDYQFSKSIKGASIPLGVEALLFLFRDD